MTPRNKHLTRLLYGTIAWVFWTVILIALIGLVGLFEWLLGHPGYLVGLLIACVVVVGLYLTGWSIDSDMKKEKDL